MQPFRGALLGVTLMLSGLILRAPAYAALPGPPTLPGNSVIYKATEEQGAFRFFGPAAFEAGATTIRLINGGQEPHQALLFRVPEGKTSQEVEKALFQNPAATLANVEYVGGPNTVAPGGYQDVVLNLKSGSYILICLEKLANGEYHFQRKMLEFITVRPSSNAASVSLPKAHDEVGLLDFHVKVPEQTTAGAQTWRVFNMGPQTHELALVKLAPGKTLTDLKSYLADPGSAAAPYAQVGGMATLSPGQEGLLAVDFQPGTYAGICFVTDPKTKLSHAKLGMVSTFEVTSAPGALSVNQGASAANQLPPVTPNTLPVTGSAASSPLAGWLAIGVVLALSGMGWLVRQRRRAV